MVGIRLGVDLGSTWSRSVNAAGDPSLVVHELGSALTRDPDGRLAVVAPLDGEPAAGSGVVDDVLLRVGDPSAVTLGGVETTAGELLETLFAALVAPHVPVDEAAVAVPATWGPQRRAAIAELGGRNGVGPVRTVNAAEALVAAFGPDARLGVGALVLVVDAGAQHLECALVRLSADSAGQVGHADGVERLGGDTLDRLLLRHCADQLEAVGVALDPLRQGTHLAECRRARERLSTAERDVVQLDGAGAVPITRAAFEALAAPVLLALGELIDRTLAQAAVPADSLHAAFLVGGLAHTPALQARVEQHAAGAPTSSPGDPQLATVRATARWLARHSTPEPAAPPTPRPRPGRRRAVVSAAAALLVAAGLAVGLGLSGSDGAPHGGPAPVAATSDSAPAPGDPSRSTPAGTASPTGPTPAGTASATGPDPASTGPHTIPAGAPPASTAHPSSSKTPRPNGPALPGTVAHRYRLVNSATGFALALSLDHAAGAALSTAPTTADRPAQVWMIKFLPQHGWTIVNLLTGDAASAPDGTHGNGSRVVQLAHHDKLAAQQWRLMKLHSGRIVVINELTGQAMSLGGPAKSGVVRPVELAALDVLSPAQQWTLAPL